MSSATVRRAVGFEQETKFQMSHATWLTAPVEADAQNRRMPFCSAGLTSRRGTGEADSSVAVRASRRRGVQAMPATCVPTDVTSLVARSPGILRVGGRGCPFETLYGLVARRHTTMALRASVHAASPRVLAGPAGEAQHDAAQASPRVEIGRLLRTRSRARTTRVPVRRPRNWSRMIVSAAPPCDRPPAAGRPDVGFRARAPRAPMRRPPPQRACPRARPGRRGARAIARARRRGGENTRHDMRRNIPVPGEIPLSSRPPNSGVSSGGPSPSARRIDAPSSPWRRAAPERPEVATRRGSADQRARGATASDSPVAQRPRRRAVCADKTASASPGPPVASARRARRARAPRRGGPGRCRRAKEKRLDGVQRASGGSGAGRGRSPAWGKRGDA